MKIALHTDLFQGQSFEEAAPAIVEAGYTYIELNIMPFWKPHIKFFEEDESRIPRFRSQLGSLELASMCICTDLAVLDKTERMRNIAYCERALRFGQAFGCEVGSLYFSGNMLFEETKQKQALYESLQQLNEVSMETGVDLAVEIHHGNFVDSTQRALELLDEFQLPHVGYLFCVSHVATYCNEDIFQAFEASKGGIRHMHISDTPLSIQNHKHLAPGHGELDLAVFMEELVKSGYDKIVTVQLYSEENHKIAYAREAREFISQYCR